MSVRDVLIKQLVGELVRNCGLDVAEATEHLSAMTDEELCELVSDTPPLFAPIPEPTEAPDVSSLLDRLWKTHNSQN